ncbi:hypothetical protein ES332_A05G452400v1 [Gossypium tomentosum]|uniref:Uncharacterized protein n=1 Tax=Gossypium tomentosum TaxID=34277 RepID=A0A5D2QTF2_GOSTO|nr:hypothetical protein ES332_A05G452400v1 [Gossypium tomentosum]
MLVYFRFCNSLACTNLVESLLVYLDVYMNVSIKFVYYMLVMCIMLHLKFILDEFDMNDKSIDIVY